MRVVWFEEIVEKRAEKRIGELIEDGRYNDEGKVNWEGGEVDPGCKVRHGT
jgi:hypothetical protein